MNRGAVFSIRTARYDRAVVPGFLLASSLVAVGSLEPPVDRDVWGTVKDPEPEAAAPATGAEGGPATEAGPATGPDPTADDAESVEIAAQEEARAQRKAEKAARRKAAAKSNGVPPAFNQWSMDLAPGASFVFGQGYRAIGGGLRVNAWNHAWRGNFLVGGGPSIHYNYIADRVNEDVVHLGTANGDFIVGGGRPDRVAAYFHVTAGLGVIAVRDGATGLHVVSLGARAGGGAGLYGHVTKRVTLGFLVDAGWMGGLGLDTFLTLGFQFEKRTR